MARMTKAMLECENEQLKQQVAMLTAQVTKPAPKPAATNRIAITLDNPLFGDLPRYPAHQRIECPHCGPSRANKIGVCTLCACERVRGRMAA